MSKKRYSILVILVIFAGMVSCALENRQLQSPEEKANKYITHNQMAKKNTDMSESILIYLATGAFDPLAKTGPPALPQELTLKGYLTDETGYYILQFKGPVLEKWKEAVISAGAKIFDYIPQFAFLVRMDQKTWMAVKTMDSVRWIGIYQPGYRIAPELMTTASEQGNRLIKVIASIFKGENVSSLVLEMERLGGKILVLSVEKKRIRLKIPINKIFDLSRLSGIRYIESSPEFKLFPNINIKKED